MVAAAGPVTTASNNYVAGVMQSVVCPFLALAAVQYPETKRQAPHSACLPARRLPVCPGASGSWGPEIMHRSWLQK